MKKTVMLLAAALMTAFTMSAQTPATKTTKADSPRCEKCAPKVCDKKCSTDCKPDCSDCKRPCAQKETSTKQTKACKHDKQTKACKHDKTQVCPQQTKKCEKANK